MFQTGWGESPMPIHTDSMVISWSHKSVMLASCLHAPFTTLQLYIHLAAASKSTVYIFLITQRAGGSYTSGYMHPQG